MAVNSRPAPGGNTKALVSVIIRTCDRPDFLRRALASLTEQQHPVIEAVVVNDGTEPVENICKDFQDRLSALHIETPSPGGDRVRAANTGLQRATGDYIIFLDDDDWFLPDHLLKLVQALESNPEYGVAYTGVDCVRLNQNSGEFDHVHSYNQPFDRAALLLRNYIPMHAALFRRSFVDEGLRMDESLTYYEDWDFWLQLNKQTEFTYVPGISAIYYLGEGSGFGVDDSPAQVAREDRFFKKWRKQWSAQDLRKVIQYARQVPELNQKAHEIGTTLKAARQSHAQTRKRLLAGQKRYNNLIGAYRALETRGEALGHILAALQAEHTLVTNSRSWKITAPLRYVLAALRRLKHGEAITTNANAEEELQVIQPLKLIAVDNNNRGKILREIALPHAYGPAVSVIIPAYNHVDLTLACLLSISRCMPFREVEFIVVDDASVDDTAKLLPQIDNLVYLRQESNRGFVYSCNLGAEKARGDYLMFLNNDTQVTWEWLDALAETLDLNPDAGIAGSKLIYPSGHLQEAGVSIHQDGTVTMVGLNEDPADPRFNYQREVDHCSGAAMMIRSGLFRELKGFSTDYAPAYFEDSDLSLRVRQLGHKVLYQPRSTIIHHLSVTTSAMEGGKQEMIEQNKKVFLDNWSHTLREEDKVRLIAFYLPQYHPIPENDAWWGKGFTEWSNVTRTRPMYHDHYQPHEPADLGYYDLRMEQVRMEQARLAREYGIYGFCYYYYWFSGKRLLDQPLQEMLSSGKPDFPFCLCWANENWTRRWDGRDAEILIAQEYSVKAARDFINELLPVFRDTRYIRVHGKPLLLIYRTDEIPDLAETVHLWRQATSDAGLEDLYLAAVASFHGVSQRDRELFDAVVEFPPHGGVGETAQKPSGLDPAFGGKFFDYRELMKTFVSRIPDADPAWRCVMPSWDNSARRQQQATIFLDSSPDLYGEWLQHAVTETRNTRMGDERLVFVNAWNEWAEGNHLEPDRKYGHAFLEATRAALGKMGYYDTDNLSHLKLAGAPAKGLAPGITLIGHPFEVLGRAEDIRTSACACNAAGIPFSLVNVRGDYGRENISNHPDFPYFHLVGNAAPMRANLLFLNADEINGAARILDRNTFSGPYNIGCFAWELSNFPDPWTGTFDLLHEIWAPTRFIHEAISKKAAIPVEHMPFAIEPGPVIGASREVFNLPGDKFVFLFFFDFRSYIQRKNPWAVLEAFRKAFPDNSRAPVHLVIKVNGQADKPDEFKKFARELAAMGDRVQLLESTLDDREIKALVQLSDCFVSLHRSEGFGRGLAEAMYYGKPVIATAWSGNMDFMNTDNACLVNYELIAVGPDDYPYGAGQVWADADTEQAAAFMQKLVEDEEYARAIGKRAAAYIREHHSYAVVGASYRRRLEQLSLL